jgi:hypothetical protein
MATTRWLGGATPVAQVDTFTVGGILEIGDKFKVTINGKTVSTSCTTTNTTTTATEIATALEASTHPEFEEVAWTSSGAVVYGTASSAGKPFTATATTTESNDGAADDQTFTRAASVANSGPNCWDTASNWSGGSVPGADDVIIDVPVDILYGLDQNGVTLTSLTILPSFGSAKLGLPQHTGEYYEYREQYLKANCTTCNVDCNSGRIKLNFQAAQTTLNVFGTGQGVESGLEALLWKGTHASNVLNIRGGSVGVGVFGGDVATIATLRVGYDNGQASDAVVRLGGQGSTITLTTITKTGGSLVFGNNVTTFNQYGGETEILGTATITTLNGYGGKFRHHSSGTLTNCNLFDRVWLDFSGDPRTKTVTTTDLYSKDVQITDPDKVATWTNGIDFNGVNPLAMRSLNLGAHIKLTPAAVS